MKKLFVLSLLLLFLGSSCKKNSVIQSPEVEKKYGSLIEVKKVIMEKIIFMAKNNPLFKKTVEDECLKQVRGDYNVALEKIIEIDQQTSILPVSEKGIFISLVNQMKDFRPNEMPIIFVPVMESRDPKEITKSKKSIEKKNFVNSNNPENYITMVDQDNEIEINKVDNRNAQRLPLPGPGCSPPEYYAGHIISNAGTLTYSNCINEALAWDTDVWVLGYEEVVSPANLIASTFDGYHPPVPSSVKLIAKPKNQSGRMEGRVEYGGRIQVTNLGNIESWTRGKPEFYHYVNSANGTEIHGHGFGKLRRRHFNNNQWIDLRCTIGSWNTSEWGNINYERWIEQDGGDSAPISFNSVYVFNGVTNTITVTIPAKSLDENLGLANIQFNDRTAWFPPLAIGSYDPFKYSYYSMNMQRQDW